MKNNWITVALRNKQFFSLAELNAAISEKLKAYNARRFQKKECSRESTLADAIMDRISYDSY